MVKTILTDCKFEISLLSIYIHENNILLVRNRYRTGKANFGATEIQQGEVTLLPQNSIFKISSRCISGRFFN